MNTTEMKNKNEVQGNHARWLSGIALLVIGAELGWFINLYIDFGVLEFGYWSIGYLPVYLIIILPVTFLNKAAYAYFRPGKSTIPESRPGMYGIIAALLLVMIVGVWRNELIQAGIAPASTLGYVIAMAVSYLTAYLWDKPWAKPANS